MKHWISAARPRTLPLALSSILMGSFLAAGDSKFSWIIFLLAVLTTTFLQILSNFANDYGDTISGVDSSERTIATRAVQTGAITREAMRNAMITTSTLAFITGSILIYEGLKDTDTQTILSFFGIGILAIIAAITYTVGKRPYGYAGFGDISVLIFFGWVGVLGTYFLHTHTLNILYILPATTCGLFAVGVLNINNIRDIESDKKTGKISIPVRLGRNNAVVYHWSLLVIGLILSIIFTYITTQTTYLIEHQLSTNSFFYSVLNWLFLVTIPLLWKIGSGVSKAQNSAQTDPFLKVMALTTLLFVITFGIGQIF